MTPAPAVALLVRIALIALVAGAPTGGSTSTLVQTDTFRLAFPSTWRAVPNRKPLQVLGPGGVVVTITPTFVSGEGRPAELRAIVAEVESNALRAIGLTQRDNGLITQRPLKHTILNDQSSFYETLAFTPDRKEFIAQYSVARQRSIILVTQEGPMKALPSFETVRAVVMSVKWLR